MADFPTKPTLSLGESPSLYDVETEDNSIAADTDGGYEFRRRRFTRTRRRTFKTGFLNLPHADYLVLDAFWEQHQKDVAFTWYNQLRGTTHQVRFDEFDVDYVGIGTNKMWTVKITMSEI